MLPNDALKAVRSATSASPRSWVTGWWPPTSVDPSPFHSRSAISNRSAMSPAGWHNPRHGVHGLRQGCDRVLRRPGRQQQPRVVARQQAPLRGRGAPPDGGAAPGRGRRSSARPSCSARTATPASPRTRRPYKTNIAAVIYRRRRRVRVRVAVRRGAARRRRRLPPRPRPAGPPARGDRRRPHRQGARGDRRRRCARPRPTSPPTTSLKTAPRGYSADHPRIDLLRQDGIIGIWAHRPGAWLHKPPRPRTASSTAGEPSDRSTTGWPTHVGLSTMTR